MDIDRRKAMGAGAVALAGVSSGSIAIAGSQSEGTDFPIANGKLSVSGTPTFLGTGVTQRAEELDSIASNLFNRKSINIRRDDNGVRHYTGVSAMPFQKTFNGINAAACFVLADIQPVPDVYHAKVTLTGVDLYREVVIDVINDAFDVARTISKSRGTTFRGSRVTRTVVNGIEEIKNGYDLWEDLKFPHAPDMSGSVFIFGFCSQQFGHIRENDDGTVTLYREKDYAQPETIRVDFKIEVIDVPYTA